MHFRPPATPTNRSGCSSAKLPYHSKRAAEEARDHSDRERGTRLAVYQCHECLQWHLTSKPENE